MSQSGKRGGLKIEATAPVAAEFWDQFVRDWGIVKYIGNVYSEYRWAMGIRDLAFRLINYVEVSRNTEEQDEELNEHILKLKPLIVWLDEWLYDCIDVITKRYGRPIKRRIGFYHLRRENVMPISFEIRVVLSGFTIPMPNDEYAEYRAHALYGRVVNGERKGGVKNICNIIEAHFHHIVKIKNTQEFVFEEEKIEIGDEEEESSSPEDSIEEVAKQRIRDQMERLKSVGAELEE